MNFTIKLIFLIISILEQAKASFILIEHHDSYTQAYQVMEIFHRQYNIPLEMIHLKSNDETKCEKYNEDYKIQLCLLSDKKLHLIGFNKKFINETLRVFYAEN